MSIECLATYQYAERLAEDLTSDFQLEAEDALTKLVAMKAKGFEDRQRKSIKKINESTFLACF